MLEFLRYPEEMEVGTPLAVPLRSAHSGYEVTMRPLIVFPLVLMACIHVEPIKPVLSPPETSDFASALVSIQAVNPSLPCEDFKGKRTGIVVHPNGYVLTTNSVLEAINSSDIEVCHQNQTRARAIVVGKDPLTDLAVLKIGSSGLRYLGWADPNSVTVGDPVVMANLTAPSKYSQSRISE